MKSFKNCAVAGTIAAAVAGGLFAGNAVAAEPGSSKGDRPLYAVQPGLRPNVMQQTTLPTWNFKYTYNGRSYSDIFVGTDPAGNASTTVPTYIIPVILKYGTTKESPLKKLPNGNTVIQNIVASPMFQSSVDFVEAGTDLGTTQYVDAFQRASLWGSVKTNSNYHVLLGAPTVEKPVTLTVPSADGLVTTAFGVKVIEASINWFDSQIPSLLKKYNIPANSLPIFVTTQAYLLESNKSGCCIGGYHSYTGTQAYSHFTYIQKAGVFAQDVSALSHEVSEWLDDPETNNNSPCGIYEVGDPLEGDANYGGYPYTTNGFTYNLQDEVTPTYFGAPASTSLNGAQTLQQTKLAVCQNGS